MLARALCGLFLVAMFVPLGCASGERTLSLSGPHREAKLTAGLEDKHDHENDVIIVRED